MHTHNENMRIKFVSWLKQTFILFICLETKNKQIILLWPNNQCLPKFNKNTQQIHRIESNQLLSTDLFVQIQYIVSLFILISNYLNWCAINRCAAAGEKLFRSTVWSQFLCTSERFIGFIHCILKSWKWDRRGKKRENRQIITENPVRWQFSLIYSDRLATYTQSKKNEKQTTTKT